MPAPRHRPPRPRNANLPIGRRTANLPICLRALTLAAALAAQTALSPAAVITKADNNNPLNLPSSWLTGIPTSSDIALWNSTISQPNFSVLGSNQSWNGIQFTNPAADVTLNNDSYTLTLGSAGIDLSASAHNLSLSAFLTLSADQTWTTTSQLTLAGPLNLQSHTLTIQGPGLTAINANLTGPSAALIQNGPGTLALSGLNSFSGGITLNSGLLSLQSPSAAGSGPLTLNGGTLALSPLSTTLTTPLIINGNVTITQPANPVVSTSGTTSGTGTLNVNLNGGTLSVAPGDIVNLSGTLSLGNSSGIVRLPNALAMGNAALDLGNGTATVMLQNGTNFTSATIGALSGGPLAVVEGSGFVNGGRTTYTIGSLNTNSTFAGSIIDGPSFQGTTAVFKVGTGTLTLTGTGSNFSQGMHIQAGAVEITTPAAIIGGAALGSSNSTASTEIRYIGPAGALALTVNSPLATIDSSGTGPLSITGTNAASTLTLTGTNADLNQLQNTFFISSSTTSIVKNGPGTWLLTGFANKLNLNRPIIVNAGTLLINSSLGQNMNVTLASGATFGGIGGTDQLDRLSIGTSSHITVGIPGIDWAVGTLQITFIPQFPNTATSLDLHLQPAPAPSDLLSTFGFNPTTPFILNLFKPGTSSPFTANGTYPLVKFNSPFNGNLANIQVGNADTSSSVTYTFSLANPATLSFNTLLVTISGGGVTSNLQPQNATSSTWGTPSNWSGPVPGNAAGDIAVLGTSSVSSASLLLDSNRRLDTLIFNSPSTSYSIDPSGGKLIFDGNPSYASLMSLSGQHTINTDIQLDSTLTAIITSSLSINGNIASNPSQPAAGLILKTGTLILSGHNTISGPINIRPGALFQINPGASSATVGTGILTIDGTLVSARADTVTLSNPLAGAGTLTQAGTGALVLASSASSFTGKTVLLAGTIALASSATLQNSFISYSATNGTLAFTNGIISATVGGITGDHNLDLTNGQGAGVTLNISYDHPTTSTFPISSDLTLGGLISGGPGASIIKSGRSILSLTNTANTFDGGLVIAGGAVAINLAGTGSPGAPTSDTVGIGPVVFAGGRLTGGPFGTTGIRNLYNNLVIQDDTTSLIDQYANTHLIFAGNILSGSGTLTRDLGQGVLTFAGRNGPWAAYGSPLPQNGSAPGFTGIFVNDQDQAGTVDFSNKFSGSPNAQWNFNSLYINQVQSAHMVVMLSDINGTILFGNLNAVQPITATTSHATLRIGDLNLNSTISGNIDNGAGGSNGIGIIKVGTGTLTLSGNNSYALPIPDFPQQASALNGFSTVLLNGAILAQSATALGAGPLALGDVAGNNNASLLFAFTALSTTLANPITTIAGSTGTLSISNLYDTNLILTGPITLNRALILSQPLSATNNRLTFAAPVTGPANLLISGPGTIALSATTSSKIHTLQIASNPAGYTATFDLTTSKLINQTTDPNDKTTQISQLTAAIKSGASGGTWTGPGLTSSTAAADPTHYAVALFDNATLQLPTFGNQPTDTNSLLVSIAHLGDANADGIIDIQDQSIITNNWQTPSTTWSTGDLNLDGFVDIQDLTIVTNNWQQSSAFSLTPNPYPLTPSSVPEPLTLTLLLTSLLFALRRKHSRKPTTP